jgi:RNA polymerase sigma factor (TIGR02999 family)
VSDVTLILQRLERGDTGAEAELLSAVYAELRRLAAAKMGREPAGQTLQATALVHEAWLRLGGDRQPTWQNRAHFFGAAAEAMRRILIERARRRRAQRHGGGQERIDLDEVAIAAPAAQDERLLDVNDALDRFAALEPQKAEFVKLRYFAGLTLEEAAQTLDISPATAKRWWTFARSWLFRELHPESAAPAPATPLATLPP